MFDHYVEARTQRWRKPVVGPVIVTVVLNVVIVCGLLARASWVLESLSPPDSAVTIAAAPPPPPPPPPGSKVHEHHMTPHLRKVHGTVQPDKHNKQPERKDTSNGDGIMDGVKDGVTSGRVDGLLGSHGAGSRLGTGSRGNGPLVANSAPRIVPQVVLEAQRIAGDQYIEPSDPTKIAIKRDGRARVVVAVRMCLSARGSVTKLRILRSSGYVAYDRLILSKMHGWRYRPFKVNAKPVPVCTSVTFIYRQTR